VSELSRANALDHFVLALFENLNRRNRPKTASDANLHSCAVCARGLRNDVVSGARVSPTRWRWDGVRISPELTTRGAGRRPPGGVQTEHDIRFTGVPCDQGATRLTPALRWRQSESATRCGFTAIPLPIRAGG
jgi:hypothetical protein